MKDLNTGAICYINPIMTPLQIGIDFDDILIEFNASIHAYYNKKLGTSIQKKDVFTYDMHRVWSCEPEEAGRRVFEFCETPEHHAAIPVDGSIEGIDELGKKHKLHLITSRSPAIEDLTLRWLQKHFSDKFAGIHFTGQFFGEKSTMRTKIDVCKELGIDLMIEDSASQAKALAGAGIPVILLDMPWNQEEMPEGITRVDSWDEIVRTIQANSHTS